MMHFDRRHSFEVLGSIGIGKFRFQALINPGLVRFQRHRFGSTTVVICRCASVVYLDVGRCVDLDDT